MRQKIRMEAGAVLHNDTSLPAGEYDRTGLVIAIRPGQARAGSGVEVFSRPAPLPLGRPEVGL